MSIQAFLAAYAAVKRGSDKWNLSKLAFDIPNVEIDAYAKTKPVVPARVIRDYAGVWAAWAETTGRDILPYPIARKYRDYGAKDAVIAAIESGTPLPALPQKARKKSALVAAVEKAVDTLGEAEVIRLLAKAVSRAKPSAEKEAAA